MQIKKSLGFYYIYKRFQILSKKKAKQKIDQKNVVSKEYHNLFNIFFKKNSDIFLSYEKYHHKIILKEEQKHDHISLYKILP